MQWMTAAKHIDLSSHRGNGPFHTFYGVILHVNVDEHGTSDSFFETNPGEVTPNFQVFKNGDVHQFLPLNWQPWCQINGNFNYAAIETAGLPDEPLTTQQIDSIVDILNAYHDALGFRRVIADNPGERGLGTHQMGGAAWGGHACPGPVRADQRAHILALCKGDDRQDSSRQDQGGEHVANLQRKWPDYMHDGDYFGLASGPAQSHGGFYADERPDVAAIQGRLQALGYAPRAPRWADGVFEQPTAASVARWQQHYMPDTEYYGQVWHDDWDKLFTH